MGLDDPSGPKKQKPSSNYLKYSSLAMQMVMTIGIAAWIGYEADLYFNFRFPIFLMSLVFLSFAGIMYKLYQSISKDE